MTTGVRLRGDVGATNARFAIYDEDRQVTRIRVISVDHYVTLREAIETYLAVELIHGLLRAAALAVASPVTTDTVTMTNHPWSFSVAALRHELRIERLNVINDFTAIALAVPHLKGEDRVAIGGGKPVPATPVAVLGPGTGFEAFVRGLAPPRAVWLMVPAAAVDSVLASLEPLLEPGDTVIDGGNSYYHDDLRRAEQLRASGLHYVDVGVSGGVWPLERGYCMMIGGENAVVGRLDPIFRSLAPGIGAAPRTPGAAGEPGQAEPGYLHCGPNGAGHFVKMVHNGIEYGLMAALAEGFGILRKANVGRPETTVDAETTPLRDPRLYDYEFDLAAIAEVWRRGSVVSSWLLDLVPSALRKSVDLAALSGRVSDSGEGRWTLHAAIDEGVPAPVIATALFSRFSSRGNADFEDKLLSALRFEFGGHVEKAAN